MFKRLSDAICQNTFNKIIGAEKYHERSFMCFCVRASSASYLTKVWVQWSIHKYLRTISPGYNSLHLALREAGLPSDYKSRLAIYKDWKNRPYPNKEKSNEQV